MKIIRNSILPPKGYCAIMLFGIIFVRKDSKFYATQLAHEKIHIAQAKELWWIGFYILYILNYLLNLVRYRNHKKAYRNICFEIEAYKHQNDLGYLERRKKYGCLFKH